MERREEGEREREGEREGGGSCQWNHISARCWVTVNTRRNNTQQLLLVSFLLLFFLTTRLLSFRAAAKETRAHREREEGRGGGDRGGRACTGTEQREEEEGEPQSPLWPPKERGVTSALRTFALASPSWRAHVAAAPALGSAGTTAAIEVRTLTLPPPTPPPPLPPVPPDGVCGRESAGVLLPHPSRVARSCRELPGPRPAAWPLWACTAERCRYSPWWTERLRCGQRSLPSLHGVAARAIRWGLWRAPTGPG